MAGLLQKRTAGKIPQYFHKLGEPSKQRLHCHWLYSTAVGAAVQSFEAIKSRWRPISSDCCSTTSSVVYPYSAEAKAPKSQQCPQKSPKRPLFLSNLQTSCGQISERGNLYLLVTNQCHLSACWKILLQLPSQSQPRVSKKCSPGTMGRSPSKGLKHVPFTGSRKVYLQGFFIREWKLSKSTKRLRGPPKATKSLPFNKAFVQQKDWIAEALLPHLRITLEMLKAFLTKFK